LIAKKAVFLGVALLVLSAVPAFAYPPVLYANGSSVSPVSGDQQDAYIRFDYNKMYTFTMLAEYTNWSQVNRFGIAARGVDPRTSGFQVFSGANAPVMNSGQYWTTNPGGLDISLWLHNDIDGNGIISGNDSYLVSQRSFTEGSAANEHQWFTIYDRRAFGSESYFFDTITEDWSYAGDFDYLIFIDDDHTAANWDHNDMIVGVKSNVIPEPTTLMLLGSGLLGGAVFHRRRRTC